MLSIGVTAKEKQQGSKKNARTKSVALVVATFATALRWFCAASAEHLAPVKGVISNQYPVTQRVALA